MERVDGLKLYVDGKELSEIAAKRAAYHKEQSSICFKKAAELLRNKAGAIEERAEYRGADADDAAEPDYRFSASKAQVDTSSYETKGRRHLEKADYFDFVSKHIKHGNEYVLDDSDLRTLEIVQSSSW